MLKAFLGALLFTGAVYVGFTVNQNYKKRVLFYSEYAAFLDYARERISYEKATLPEIKRGFPSKYITNTLLTNGEQTPAFLPSAQTQMKDFLANLGRSDLQNTLNAISVERTRAQTLCKKGEEDLNKKGAMAKKLCLLCGVALVIVII